MRKLPWIAAGLVGVAFLTDAAFASRRDDICGGPRCDIEVTVPGSTRPTTTSPTSRPRDYHWGATNTHPGWCDVAGQSRFNPALGPPLISSYRLGGGGSQTYHTAVLYGSDGNPIGYFQWCGPRSEPPPPLNDSDALAAVRNAGSVSINSIMIDPNMRGLTGMEATFSADLQNSGPVTAANSAFSMTATAAPKDYFWEMGDESYEYGPNPTYTFQGKGTHTITLTVTWEITYVVTGLANYTGTATLSTEYSRPYDVVEARGVLS